MTKHDWKAGERARVISVDAEDIARGIRVDDIVTIQRDCEAGFKAIACTIPSGHLRIVTINQLEPIPTEIPKDPFAPGEYVTCFKDMLPAKKIGDVVRCVKENKPSEYWFPHERTGYYTDALKSHFRPATPEEIAAYQAKYEADGEEREPGPSLKTYTLTPYIKPETVTINGVEYIMTENV